MASTTKQVWQSVGIDESHDSLGSDLLQLDLAAQRAGLASRLWDWHDIATYPTLI